MDLLAGYNSVSSEEGDDAVEVKAQVRRPDRRYLNAAPTPSLLAGRTQGQAAASSALTVVQPKKKEQSLVLMNNPTKATLYQPVQGPQGRDPQQTSAIAAGAAEANVTYDETTFQEQRITFQRTGQAQAPDIHGTVVAGSTLGYEPQRLEKFQQQDEQRQRAKEATRKRRREEGEDVLVHGSDDELTYGVWAPPSLEERMAAENQLSDVAKGGVENLAPEQLAEREHIKERDRRKGQEEEADKQEFDRLVERKMSHLLPPRMGAEEPEACKPSTTFHGNEEFDYRGRSWMEPPAGLGSVVSAEGLDMDHHRCYVPKKCIHRFTGHNKGVQRIRLFPKTGHLLLSAGLDGKCKVWSVDDKQVMRTYVGHTAAVRDVQFNLDGSRFVSASFDRFLRMWNTETGEVVNTFTNRRVPYVVQFYPHDDNLFVVGCSDNKIVTYDATTGEITQEYNHHLAPVNAIVFTEDQGTKMVSSSDDKKVLVWEWDIGVPIKYISDPTMHSMPVMTLHPSGQYFAGQSLDNTIVVFQARDRFALQRKKKFTGHQVSGYACDICFSPDGQFLMSGDGTGKIYFWEWKRHKLLQKYRAHDNGPAIGCAWHPLDPSLVFSCGWDGVIKMWR